MRINTSGWVFIILGSALIIAAYRFGFPGLLPVGIVFIGLVAFSLLAALITSSQLSAQLVADAPTLDGTAITRVGDELVVTVRAANRLPAPLLPFDLTLHSKPGFGTDQNAHIGALPPRGYADVQAVFVPTHRGMTGVEKLSAAVSGPFGLTAALRAVPGSLDVAAAPAEAPVGIPQSLSAHLSRVSSDRVSRGRGTRDYFTREYAPGDDLRYIHWKTTARLGELAVRQEAEEEHATAIVVLDGGVQPSSAQTEAGTQFETLAAAAAAAVRAYFAAGYDVRLLCGDEDIQIEARSLDLPHAELAIAQADGRSVPGSVRLPQNVETVVVCASRGSVNVNIPARAHVWAADSAAVYSGADEPVLPAQWSLTARRGR
ncbi:MULTISPECIES: DUF58 domain-containing protein [unclassified Brevibacterium]|uniref:DUF58 domain-containing protein n=1 Tax=unclassified Brevibacterium TaxID=2614124 RepID=UPI0008A37CE9|nr:MULTISPECIES: DUF58 domain-containing protein [unclassified Brevibacterium]OFL64398.1 hypothetical protein HMPREF2757_00270 [Brevibacterium sp. HMSC063G07]OFS25382.1 hypothetical protein HMPREF3162_08665 [Brevibacterium sp. HMSC07C04]